MVRETDEKCNDRYSGDGRYSVPPDDGDSCEPDCREPQPELKPLRIVPATDLVISHPERRRPLIEGLLRQGETMNVIAAPKTGKSWLTLGLALATANGLRWLDTFAARKSNVLIVDNEIHPETAAHRLRVLAEATRLSLEGIDVASLRGQLRNLLVLSALLKSQDFGHYGLIIVDAFYRTLPKKTDENNNADMAGLYNVIDATADQIGASFVMIHHSSKGSQSGKSLTDVGSGAGAMSRASDTHLVLRSHEEDGAVVLESVTRSWPPVSPICLRWSFPAWTRADDLDPTALRPERPRRPKQPKVTEPPKAPPEPPWTAKRFAEALGKPEPQTRGVILEAAAVHGLSDFKADDLLQRAEECGYLHSWQEHGKYGRKLYSTIRPEPVPAKAKPRRRK